MNKILEILEGFDASHVLALINAVGGRNIANDIAAGKKKVTVEDVIHVLFDQHGRGIPFPGMKDVVDANRSFYVTQPVIDYAAILVRLQQFFGLGFTFMPASEFQERCMVAIELVKSDLQIANLLKWPHFPFVIPQLTGDLGKLLDDNIVPALERSYLAQFPERSFNNYRHGELAGQVTVVVNTRQERLIQAMVKGSVCGVYFPTALRGFGIQADREFINHLPECLILSGMEVPVAVTAYPEIFGRDYHTPGLDMASLQWQSPKYSLLFKAHDGNALFGHRNLLAYENYSGGVSILG